MLYAILCYDSEDVVGAWTKEQDDAAIARLEAVQDDLRKQGRMGPVARLQPTRSARTLKKGAGTMILDGPFAETKEALLGFYVVDCESMEAALEVAKDLGRASSSAGSFEVRPLRVFRPGNVAS
jgi:hypothetical protein